MVRARRLVCQAPKGEMGYSGAEMASCLGVTTSDVNRVTVSEILPKVRKYLNALQNLGPAFLDRFKVALQHDRFVRHHEVISSKTNKPQRLRVLRADFPCSDLLGGL